MIYQVVDLHNYSLTFPEVQSISLKVKHTEV